MNLDFSTTKSKPDLTKLGFIGLTSRGISNIFNLSLNKSFIRTIKDNLSVIFNLKFVNISNKANGNLAFEDRIRVLSLNSSYDRADSSGASIASIGIHRGIPIFGANNNLSTRDNTSLSFTKFTLDATRFQRLYSKMAVILSASSQYSLNSLAFTEEFGVGGSIFGLAYDSSEITGDHGVAGKLQLQYYLQIKRNFWVSSVPTIYGDIDAGRVWDKNIGQSGADNQLVSAGSGTEWHVTRYMDINLTLAFPITKTPSNSSDKKPRFFFSITSSI